MTRKNLAVDWLPALVAAVLSLAILAGGGFGESPADSRELDWLGAVLVLGSAAPLLARRVSPLAVYAATSALSMVLYARGYPLDVPVAPVIAIYTLAAAYGGAPLRRRIVAMLAAAAFVPAMMAAIAVTGYDVRDMIAPDMLLLTLFLAGVWLAGDRSRLRAERMEQLEERTRRVEREAEHERRVVAAQERTRIARELHDSAGHAINVILMQAGAARLLHDRDPARSQEAIATIEAVARRTIGEIDTLVTALREDDGTEPFPADPAAIEELVERHRAAGLSVTTELDGPRPTLPQSVAWAAYRILQESLTNAARHGRGSARVAVRYLPTMLEVTVTNPLRSSLLNGSTARNGHGIIGMRERVSLLGGTLEVGTRDGAFRVHARLPHRAEAE